MLKVLIDARWIEKPRGLGRYVREMLYAIAREDFGDAEIIVLTPEGSEEHVSSLGTFKIVTLRAWPVPIWEQFIVPWWAWRLRVDLVHSPCNTTSLMLSKMRVQNLVTIHDLMFFEGHGSTLYQRLGNLYRRFIVSRFKRRGLTLVAVSRATRDRVREKFGIDAAVIYEPVANFVRVAGNVSGVSRRLGGRAYFVHIGGLAAHKNTQLVVDAFRAATLCDYCLVILGVPRSARAVGNWLADDVVIPGWISDAEVARYIAGATALIFPSLAEGYGLPILEAFSLGCPVITSAIAPMTELAGDAAFLVDPRSMAMVTDACRRLGSDDALCRLLRERGLRRAAEFSAERIGRELMAAYSRAAGVQHVGTS